MVTGHDDTASIARAYEAGATDFIHKPVLWPTLPPRIGFILRAQDNLRALQQSEQKNRALLQALPDAIYIVDRNGMLCEHITGDARAARQPGWQAAGIGTAAGGGARAREAVAHGSAAAPPRSSTSSAAARSSVPSKRGCGRSPTARC